MRIVMSASYGGRRDHWEVTGPYNDGWAIQYARATTHGHHYDPPAERGLKTKKAAMARMKELRGG